MAMKEFLKQSIKRMMPIRVLDYNRNLKDLRKWHKNNCPVPPPHVIKQSIIKQYLEEYNYTTLIETGTYLGDMVNAQKKRFKRIISIELSRELYEKAKNRFKNYNHIEIVQGDSGKVLQEVLLNLNESAIFWLDGHYSAGNTAKGEKECPVYEELDKIFKTSFSHVILIDDARFFIGQGDYPSLDALASYVSERDSRYKMEVKDDVIRFAI